jgi:hypothetical protein
LTLTTESVLDRDLDIVESDEGGASSGRVAGLDGFRLNTLASLNKNYGETILIWR